MDGWLGFNWDVKATSVGKTIS